MYLYVVESTLSTFVIRCALGDFYYTCYMFMYINKCRAIYIYIYI